MSEHELFGTCPNCEKYVVLTVRSFYIHERYIMLEIECTNCHVTLSNEMPLGEMEWFHTDETKY